MGKDYASNVIGCMGIAGSFILGIVLLFPWARGLRVHLTEYPNVDGILIGFGVTFGLGMFSYLIFSGREQIKKGISFVVFIIAIFMIALILFLPIDEFLKWLFLR